MSSAPTNRRRRLVPALAVLALGVAGVAAGCGGGGGGGASATPAAPVVPTPAAPAGLSAADAVAALGTLSAPDDASLLSSVGSYDRFGTIRDPFKPLVIAAQPTTTPAGVTVPTTGSTGVVVPPVTGLPLIPGTTTPTTTTGGTTVPPATPNPLEADIDVSGEPLVVREGDAIPPDSQEFRVEKLTTKAMTLKLTAGILPDGTDTFTLKVGRRVTLYDQGERRTYRLRLNAVRRVR
jgi:hypothetical protein